MYTYGKHSYLGRSIFFFFFSNLFVQSAIFSIQLTKSKILIFHTATLLLGSYKPLLNSRVRFYSGPVKKSRKGVVVGDNNALPKPLI